MRSIPPQEKNEMARKKRALEKNGKQRTPGGGAYWKLGEERGGRMGLAGGENVQGKIIWKGFISGGSEHRGKTLIAKASQEEAPCKIPGKNN